MNVDYLRPPPLEYHCAQCARSGVKLWRQYNCFASMIRLLCCDCAAADQKEPHLADEDGKTDTRLGCRSDAIGGLVPAVPTEEGDSYWGYTSVPDAGVGWWKSLPTRLP